MKEYIERNALMEDIEQSVVFTVKVGEKSAEMRGAHKIVDRIKCAPVVDFPGWVSVKERVPDTDDRVLCCTVTKKGTRNIVIGYYMDGAWRCGMNSNVTHWMLLPEAPCTEKCGEVSL